MLDSVIFLYWIGYLEIVLIGKTCKYAFKKESGLNMYVNFCIYES